MLSPPSESNTYDTIRRCFLFLPEIAANNVFIRNKKEQSFFVKQEKWGLEKFEYQRKHANLSRVITLA